MKGKSVTTIDNQIRRFEESDKEDHDDEEKNPQEEEGGQKKAGEAQLNPLWQADEMI